MLLAATPAYLVALGKPGDRAPTVQLLVSTVAFVVWAYALRGLSCAFPAVPFDGRVAFVALVLFTVVSGLLAPAPAPATAGTRSTPPRTGTAPPTGS